MDIWFGAKKLPCSNASRILRHKRSACPRFHLFLESLLLCWPRDVGLHHNQIYMIMEATIQTSQWAVAEIQLVYKSNVPLESRPQINGSDDAYQILKSAWDPGSIELCEQFRVLLIDHGKRVLGVCQIASGGIDRVFVDPRLIFAAALKMPTSGIILAHNHPSGSLIPSENDKQLTQKIQRGAALLDIKVFDHIILTAQGYYSFADQYLI